MSPSSTRRERESHFHFSKGKQGTVRARYLDYLQRDINQRLTASIHAARFLDIGLSQKINATVSWHYIALEGQQQFVNFDLAFEHFQGRVLLLGSPGSGKTTTLQNLALKLIAEAQQDQTADIPLFFNLSKFGDVPARRVSDQLSWLRRRKDPVEENPERVFEDWLVKMLMELPVEGLNRQVALQWVNSGRVAALLDGLDEVTDSYLIKLGEILNQTYFREHPTQTVVVCSRLIDYQPLQENKEARLRLNGAVILQPPTPQQIDDYLEAAQALSLRDALRGDNALYEMAQTPLTLSMMTLAYGGEAPTNIPQDLPFLERRRRLLDTYVERMVQRTARREEGIPFDLNPENDVPPEYPLKKTNHYLGWLAIKLSERMRTVFPFGRFYSFLATDYPPGDVGGFTIKYGIAMLAVGLIALLTNVGLLIPNGGSRLWFLLVIPVLAILAVFMRAAKNLTESVSTGETFVEILSVLLGIAYFGLCLAIVNQSLVSVLAYTVHPVITTPIIIGPLMLASLIEETFFTPVTSRVARSSPRRTLIILFLFLAFPAITLLISRDLKFTTHALSIACCCLTFTVVRFRIKSERLWGFVWGFIVGAVVVITLTVGIGSLISSQLLFALSGVIAILLGYLSDNEEWRGMPVALAVTLVIANWLGGPAVATLAVITVLLLYASVERFVVVSSRLFESVILNPLLKTGLTISTRTCFRYKSFLRYATDTVLLKQAGIEYEFVHRLLRDHFAIRELIPQLYLAQGEQRIGIIKRLSRQGDSSFDVLANFSTNEDPRVRSAAIEGLGRIAIPKVFPIMLDFVQNDSDEEVRASVVRSLSKFSSSEQDQILDLAIHDSSPQVRRTVISVSDSDRITMMGLKDDADIVFRQTLIERGKRQVFRIGGAPLDVDISDRLAQALMDSDKNVSTGAAVVVAEFFRFKLELELRKGRLPRAESLIPALVARHRDKDSEVRYHMVAALSAMAERDIAEDCKEQISKSLLNALSDRDTDVRRKAIPGLAFLGSPESLRALRESLNHSDVPQKRQVIKELGLVCDREALPLMMKYLSAPRFRYDAAKAVGDIGDHSVVPQLLSFLEDSKLQIAAIMALAELDVKSAAPKFIELFVRPPRIRWYLRPFQLQRDVRPYAAMALGKIGDVESVPRLSNFSPSLPAKLLFSQASALSILVPNVHEVIVEAIANLSVKEQHALRQKLFDKSTDAHWSSEFKSLPDLLAEFLTSDRKLRKAVLDNNDARFFDSGVLV